MSKSELACVYAALILADEGIDVTVSAARGPHMAGGMRSHPRPAVGGRPGPP